MFLGMWAGFGGYYHGCFIIRSAAADALLDGFMIFLRRLIYKHCGLPEIIEMALCLLVCDRVSGFVTRRNYGFFLGWCQATSRAFQVEPVVDDARRGVETPNLGISTPI